MIPKNNSENNGINNGHVQMQAKTQDGVAKICMMVLERHTKFCPSNYHMLKIHPFATKISPITQQYLQEKKAHLPHFLLMDPIIIYGAIEYVIEHSGAKLHAVLLIAKILKLGFQKKKNQKSLA